MIDWSTVAAWFGRRPNFHDAEVLSIELRRAPEKSVIRIDTWNTGDTVDDQGYLRRERRAVVRFTLDEIIEQELSGWNHQNVLFSLEELNTEEGQKLVLQSSFGVEGAVTAKSILVEIENADK